jgi:parvulin-like peptidyl-prolyl isomerase
MFYVNNRLLNKTKYIVVIALVITGSIVAYLWTKSVPKTLIDNTLIATISDRTITVDDLQKKMLQRSAGATQYFASPENKQALLKEMIQREIQITTALKLDYANDPDIQKSLENLLVNKLREEELKKILAASDVGDDEIENYYNTHIQKYTTPEMSRVAIIRFTAFRTASPEKHLAVKTKAEEAHELAQTLPETIKGFGSLAVTYSEDQASRYVGGDIGWMVKGRESQLYGDSIVSETAAALSKENPLSLVVQGDEGYYLVKFIDYKNSQTKPIEKVSHSIKRELQQQKYTQGEADWLQALQNDIEPIVINQAVLESVQPPPAIQEEQENKPPVLPKSVRRVEPSNE